MSSARCGGGLSGMPEGWKQWTDRLATGKQPGRKESGVGDQRMITNSRERVVLKSG